MMRSVERTSIRCVWSLVTHVDMELQKMNVKTSFLHCNLEVDIHVLQIVQLGNEQLV